MPFAAIYIPDFPVEALVRAEPELREQAVALVEGTAPLVHVVAVNERAAQAGVGPGMTRLQAEERLASSQCPVAGDQKNRQPAIGGKTPILSRPKEGRDKGGATSCIRERSRERETAAHAALLDCACGFSPRVEDTAADTVVLDLAGLERIFGPPAKIARDVARRCSEMGLEANVAVASNVDTAALAARGFAGVTVIAEGKEAERLGELGVETLVAATWGKSLPIADCRLPIGSGRNRQSTIDNQKWCEERQGLPGGAPAVLELLETLERWGVRNLRALAALPVVALAERLGQEGLRLQKLARGQTRRPLVVAEPPLVFEEAAELEYPVDTLEPLAFLLNRMLEQLCARLAARALAANELKLRFELEANAEDLVIGRSGDHPSRLSAGLPGIPGARVIENPAQVTGSPDHPISRCLRLPVAMLDAKVFLKLLQLDLQAHPPPAPVTKVWLRAEPAEPRKTQSGLFVPEAPEAERLELTIARIKKVVGDGKTQKNCRLSIADCRLQESREAAVARRQENQESTIENQQGGSETRVGSPEIVDTHCPGAFRMKPFAAGEGAHGTGNFRPIECSPGEAPGPTATKPGPTATEAPGATAQENRQSEIGNRKWGEEQQDALEGERAPASMIALRVFRPALAAVVTVREGKPAQVTSAERPTMRGGVVWCAGPWRSSGEWWTEQAWRREEWDVAVRNEEGVALYRIYRDEIGGKWWVEGSYD